MDVQSPLKLFVRRTILTHLCYQNGRPPLPKCSLGAIHKTKNNFPDFFWVKHWGRGGLQFEQSVYFVLIARYTYPGSVV